MHRTAALVCRQRGGGPLGGSRGEYLSAHHASEVYRLLGKKGLDSPTPPAVGVALTQGDIAYHNRPGGHSVDLYDWQQFLGFAERHFRN